MIVQLSRVPVQRQDANGAHDVIQESCSGHRGRASLEVEAPGLLTFQVSARVAQALRPIAGKAVGDKLYRGLALNFNLVDALDLGRHWLCPANENRAFLHMAVLRPFRDASMAVVSLGVLCCPALRFLDLPPSGLHRANHPFSGQDGSCKATNGTESTSAILSCPPLAELYLVFMRITMIE